MLKAGTDLSSFSIDEILHLDAKKIDFKAVKALVNQVNTASIPKYHPKHLPTLTGLLPTSLPV